MENNSEIWKNIPDELKLSNYLVSNLGKIKNIEKNKIIDTYNIKRHNGYIRVGLKNDNNIKKNFRLHILIANAFLGKGNKNQTVDHINRIKDDNNITNLRWASPKEQANNRKKNIKIRGRVIIQYDENKNLIKEWESINSICKIFNIMSASIRYACKKNTLSCGYYWQYKDKINLPGEIWKEFEINNKLIKISNCGRIQINLTKMGKNLDSSFSRNYFEVNINKKHFSVHRLVCAAFKNFDINSDLTINHIDRNKKNNRLDNLEILTIGENIKHSYNIGLRPKQRKCRWIKVVRTDFNNENEKIYNSITEASKDTGIHSCLISGVCKCKHKSAGGYKWRYYEN